MQSSLTTSEIQTARNCLIKEVQAEHFPEIIHELQQGKPLFIIKFKDLAFSPLPSEIARGPELKGLSSLTRN